MKQNATITGINEKSLPMASGKSKKTSIYTLSEELGVSPATISRALNNHPTVSAGVRARVQQIADQRKFRPRVVSNRVTNICVLIQQYDGHPLDFGAFLSQTMEGIAQYCRHENLEMSLYSTHVRELNQCDLVRELRRRNADGAVIVRANDQTRYLSQLDEQRFPYFCLFSNDDKNPKPILPINDEVLAYTATKHLISLGHRKIGMLINAPFSAFSRRRQAGYERALREHGIQPDDNLILTSDPDIHRGGLEFGARGIEELLRRDFAVSAVFCVEASARGALTWLYKHNIKCPDRISIVGFDDFPETAYTCPPLTTIRVPYLELGYEGARQVHRLCRGLDVLLTGEVMDRLAGELVIRESTAKPGQQK
jgi:LacI family transcriptional regulator